MIEHNAAGTLSVVRGPWKYIGPSGAPAYNPWTDIELGNDPDPQLYNLDDDVGERRNVASEYPAIAAELSTLLARIKSGPGVRAPTLNEDRRSTPSDTSEMS